MTQHEKSHLERIDERLDSTEEVVNKMDRNILELLIAMRGNEEFKQDGLIQNLKTLSTKVDNLQEAFDKLADRQDKTESEVQSLDGSRRWLRAKASWAAAGIGSSIASGIIWAITHIQEIKSLFNPIPK